MIPTGDKKPPVGSVENSEDDSDGNEIAMNIKFPPIEGKKHGIISTTMQKDISGSKAAYGATQGPFGLQKASTKKNFEAFCNPKGP